MITLYGYDTINTLKVLMFLCETGLDHEFKSINIRAGEQHSAEFRAINPAGKVPVIWDGDMHQTEANSILLSLVSTPDQNCTERRRESAPFGWIWPE